MTVSVRQRVFEIIAQQAITDVSKIDESTTPESLGLDSLGLVETIFSIEETFNITVPFNATEASGAGFDISNIGAIVAAVERLVDAEIRQPA